MSSVMVKMIMTKSRRIMLVEMKVTGRMSLDLGFEERLSRELNAIEEITLEISKLSNSFPNFKTSTHHY